MRRRVRMGGLLLTLCLALLFAQAAQAQALDLQATGSITVYLREGEVRLYQVGEAEIRDNNLCFRMTEAFQASGASLDDLNSPKLADELARYARAHEELPRRTQAAVQGRAVFESLPCGLYLVLGPEGQSLPFLAAIPSINERGDGWLYDLEAYPKTGPAPSPSIVPEPTATPEPTLPQTGLNRWPVPVMAAGGLLLFALGWALCFVRKKHD